ncbi:MAG: hypothetical protein A4S14_07090 [Proteobacteria bacterium SG_bin9]|nr:MAG: hypothetical protein A4S14_07090 [Proteobacteria bacterium SG_bin9]
MKRVLVTGATGFVGSALAARLSQADGFAPVAVTRRPFAFPDGVEAVQVRDLSELGPKLRGIDTVVHCAARVHVMREEAANPLAAFRKDNVETPLRLAEDAARAGVRRFVFLSSVKANGEETFDAPLTELTQPRPETPYGQSKLEAEDGLRAIAGRTSLEIVSLRPPLVYAGHAGGNFARLLRWLCRGLPLPLGSVDNKRSYIALDNLVDVLVRAIDHPKAANEVFLVSDGDDLSTPEMLRAIVEGMDKEAALLPFPVPLIRLAATMLGQRDAARQVCGSLAIDSRKVRETLSWQPPLGARDALRAAGAAFAARQVSG